MGVGVWSEGYGWNERGVGYLGDFCLLDWYIELFILTTPFYFYELKNFL